MDRDKTAQVPQPTDSSVDEIVGIDGNTSGDGDTEGHSMLTIDLAYTMTRERVREGEKAGRDRALLRDSHLKRDGGFLERLRRR